MGGLILGSSRGLMPLWTLPTMTELVATPPRPSHAPVEVPRQTELEIGGMTCASCSARVEKALAKVPGVARASVNLATETASVDFGDAPADPQALLEAVKKAGYEATLLAPPDASGRDSDTAGANANANANAKPKSKSLTFWVYGLGQEMR